MCGSMRLVSWNAIGGRSFHIHRPVILLCHPFKTVFRSNFTYVAYLSSMTVHLASHKGGMLRRLLISTLSMAFSLA